MGQPVVHFEILGKDADKTQSYPIVSSRER
jgi:hypothetical protein